MLLENLNLVNEEGKLKNAALLLFAKKPQKYFTCVQFKIGRFGADEADLMFQDVIEGNIIQMADRVVEMLKAKYLIMPITFKGMNRIEKLEVPEEALREILYNAIIHKDYTGVHIQMRVWNDCVEVWNEGELPVGYTPDTLLKQHASHPRNRNIANAFFKAGFIDAWGRGYKKICEGFEAAGLPMPKVENFCGGVRVTFQRKNVNMAKPNSTDTQDVAVNVAEELTERQQTIVELINKGVADNVAVNTKYLSEKLSVNRKTIQRDVAYLQERKLIQWVGSDKIGHWEIIYHKE